MREAKNNVFKQKLHDELQLYFDCYNAWNCEEKHRGPIKVYKSKVTAFYTNVFKQRCEVYLGGNLVEAADHCKRQKKWWSLLIQLLCNLK